MRRRLGGRTGNEHARELGLTASGDSGVSGVVLAADATHLFVWNGAAEVRRCARDTVRVTPGDGSTDAERAVARWSALQERQRVQCRGPSGDWFDALLVEKCRFGALVAHADGSITAVGFESVRPAPGAVH